MQSRFQTIRSRFTPSGIRTSSSSSSPVSTINAVLFRQPSIADLEEEKRSSGPELNILEPRPIVYWGGVEERMGSLNF
ncbi:hypothetical protein F4774DRAFT_413189 [Daldinia eschscholtzii]|nr:hypothetical protein F4774DRAFT_413189 [Daldinia eschscholtzii]